MLRLLYFLFSGFYGLGVFIRNLLYDSRILRSEEFEVPVISVGNITVGGTGKTPHTEYLARLLKVRQRVAVLSRGYKRKTKGFRMVELTSQVSEVGDEPLQIKLKYPDVTVAVCENRVSGLKELLKNENAPGVVLLDDAFQHRRITRGINILLIDYSRPIREDYLLPAGRLREGAIQRYRANIIIITKCPADIKPMTRGVITKSLNVYPFQEIYFTTLVHGQPQPVFSSAASFDLFFKFSEYVVVVVTGIASPDELISHFNNNALRVVPVIFPDHHYFSSDDIRLIIKKFTEQPETKKIIITTEKDAVRFRENRDIPPVVAENLYYIPLKIRFLIESKNFDQRIISYAGKNKNDRKLYPEVN